MLEAIRKDLNETIKTEFPGYEIVADPLSLSISCHVGRGALGIGIIKNLSNYDDDYR